MSDVEIDVTIDGKHIGGLHLKHGSTGEYRAKILRVFCEQVLDLIAHKEAQQKEALR